MTIQWTEELQSELDKAEMHDMISDDLCKTLVYMNRELLMFPDDVTMKPDDARRLVKRYLEEY